MLYNQEMDTDQLITQGRARFEHAAAKRLLREKYRSKMLFAYRGGMWQAGPELYNLISSCNRVGEVVLPDLYENPVMVDTTELLDISQERWNEQMTAWYLEYEELRKKR